MWKRNKYHLKKEKEKIKEDLFEKDNWKEKKKNTPRKLDAIGNLGIKSYILKTCLEPCIYLLGWFVLV